MFNQKKIQKVLMKIEEMADVFLNSANFAPHALLNLAPPSGYTLKLKTLIKVSKVSWTSQLSYEILRSSFESKFDKTNFISPKKNTSQKPGLFWVKFFSNKILTMRAKVRGYVHCIFSDVSQIIGHINLFLIKQREILHGGNAVCICFDSLALDM